LPCFSQKVVELSVVKCYNPFVLRFGEEQIERSERDIEKGQSIKRFILYFAISAQKVLLNIKFLEERRK